MNVLLLSVAIGSGHNKAANAVMGEISKRYPLSKIRLVDTLKHINPILDKLIVKGYLGSLKTTPIIFKKIYELTGERNETGAIGKRFNRLLGFRFQKLVNQFEPDVIVCTHPFGMQIVLNLKRKGKIKVPVVAVVTDFAVHSFWVESNVDAYIVPSEATCFDLVERGISEHSVYVTGMPVEENFYTNYDKVKLRKEFGLKDKLTALVMGGSLGLGQINRIVNSMLLMEKDIQIIVVSGNNSKLKKKMESIARESDKKMLVFGYTEKVAELMEISDFVVTKPGGMTISEALCKSIPIVIISPIPGHEEENAKFLVNQGLAVWVFDDEEVEKVIWGLVSNPLRLKQMKEMANYFGKRNAAREVVDVMEKVIFLKKRIFNNNSEINSC